MALELADMAIEIGGPIAVLLLAMVGIIGIVYMIGSLISNDGVKAWAKIELFEVMYSAVLFLLIFSFIPVFDGVVQSAAYGMYPNTDSSGAASIKEICLTGATVSASYEGLPCHLRLSKYYLSSLFDEITEYNFQIYNWYTVTSFISDMYMTMEAIWESRAYLNYNPLRGFVHMGNTIKQHAFEFGVRIAIIAKFQEIMLHLINDALFPMLLAGGIMFRSFYFTRKLGGLLMALAIGLYFIFPLSYIFAGAVYESVGGAGSLTLENLEKGSETLLNPFAASGITVDSRSLDDLKTEYGLVDGSWTSEKLNEEMKLKGSFDVCKLIADKDVDPQAPTPGSDAYLASTQSWYEAFTKEGIFIGTDSIIGIDSGNYLDMIARFIFFSMFFSFFGLMATVAGIRSLSITFGGDIEIAGLTRLI